MIQGIPYRLRYSRRAKRLSLQVVPGEVRVTAPPGASISVIDQFVRSRTQWLTEKLACFSSIAPPAVPAEFTDGSEVSVFGEKSVLHLSEAASEVEKLIQRNRVLYVYLLRGSDLTLTVRKWLDELLLSHVKGVADEYSHLGLIPSRIRLGKARTRWGSCSPRGVIMINRRLVHAPLKVVGYVVVHELAHLRNGNHSKKFWEVVESILGDVKEEKQWLRLQGAYLLEEE
ncbi:MAG: M48 family metallopeptidase [Candidatus Aegiribacteria sp.]|nr:M48 family metallopeptidase [Candidatus Aegiribacteria sp.]